MMSQDLGWIEPLLKTARPRAVAALLRYFGSVEVAEEAFQEASLRALRRWSEQGAPRDPTAWLVAVARNAGVDGIRRAAREAALPDEISPPLVEGEDHLIDAIDDAEYGDDILRLLFICCHRDLPATQQIALALRVVCGLGVPEIARAFLVSEAAMEQRLTRAKRVIAQADIRFETPSAALRRERLATVLAMLYLMFTRGYTASAREAERQQSLCDEAIRLARIVAGLFSQEPEAMGLLALMLLQHSRRAARFDDNGAIVLLENQDRERWDHRAVAEGTAAVDAAFSMGRPGPYQVQAAIASLHARARRFEQTDWAQIERLYAALYKMQPSPVIALNHAVAIWHARGPDEALEMVERQASALGNYFYFHAVRGQLLHSLGRNAAAEDALQTCLGLAESAAEAAQIRSYLDQVRAGGPPMRRGEAGIEPKAKGTS